MGTGRRRHAEAELTAGSTFPLVWSSVFPASSSHWVDQLVKLSAAAGFSGSGEASGTTFSWGLCADARGKPVVRKPQGEFWRLLPALNTVLADALKGSGVSPQFPKDGRARMQWTSLQINDNTSSMWHVDSESIGWSAIFALGEYSA